MAPVSDIAASALTAFGVRQTVTANNIANSTTPGFKAAQTVMQTNGSGGISANIVQGQDQVDISREAVDLLSSTEGYKANAKVLKTEDEMTRTLLNLKA